LHRPQSGGETASRELEENPLFVIGAYLTSVLDKEICPALLNLPLNSLLLQTSLGEGFEMRAKFLTAPTDGTKGLHTPFFI
jgi:hypothetical protein